MRRFPVTTAEYLDFLNDLVACGREAEALAACPRAPLSLSEAGEAPAVQQVAATVFAADVAVPEPDEHVALGAAAQAARAIGGGDDPGWQPLPVTPCPGEPVPHVRARYRDAAERLANQAR